MTPKAPTCPTCERSWTSLTQAHCSICHEHFSTVKNFDIHKPGPRRPDGTPSCGADRRGGIPRTPGTLTRTKRNGDEIPLLKQTSTIFGPMWVSWSDDGHYTEETA